jgi:ABC-2 type transport system permease protein
VNRVSLKTQILELSRRAALRTLRQPLQIVPPILFPLILLAVNVGGLDAATKIPGFPSDSYLDFALSFAFMQGTMFASISAGTDLARDIETGFFKRLALTPMRRVALLVGQLAGVMIIALVSGVSYLVVGLIAGVHFKSGPGGVVVLFALFALISLAWSAIGAFLGLSFGRAEAVQGFFPLLFVLLFLSSMSIPRNLIEQDWFRTIATWNPVSYMVEGLRSLIITGWDGAALWRGFAVAIVIAAIGLIGSARSLRTRLVRT